MEALGREAPRPGKRSREVAEAGFKPILREESMSGDVESLLHGREQGHASLLSRGLP